MANTRFIKLTKNGYTYLPVTLASGVQYTYAGGGHMSVQDAIGTIAQAALPIGDHITDSVEFSYNGGIIKLNKAHPESTSSLKGEGLTYIKDGGNGSYIIGTTATANLGTVTKVEAGNGLTSSVTGGITTTGTISHATVGAVSKTYYATANKYFSELKFDQFGHLNAYTTASLPTGANNVNISAKDDSNATKILFTTNSNANRTINVLGDVNGPITTKVEGSDNAATIRINHDTQTSNVGTYGTNSLSTIGSGTTGNLIIPEYTVNSYGHVTASSSKTISINIPDLGGLTGAMHYKGKKTSLPTSLPGTYIVGDVISYNNAEYVLEYENNTYAWRELGDEGSHALKTISITGTDGLTGGGTLAEDRTISHDVPSGASAGKKNSASNNFINSVTTDKFGHVTAYTTGTFTESNGFGTVTSVTDKTGADAGTTTKASATADSVTDTLNIVGGNKWITTGIHAASDTAYINHAINPTGSDKAATKPSGTLTSGTSVVLTGLTYTTDAAGHLEKISLTGGTFVNSDRAFVVANPATATQTNATGTNNGMFINVWAGETAANTTTANKHSIKLVGSGTTTVKSSTAGTITIDTPAISVTPEKNLEVYVYPNDVDDFTLPLGTATKLTDIVTNVSQS